MRGHRELDALVAEKVFGSPAFARQVLGKLGKHVWHHNNVYGHCCMMCGVKDGDERSRFCLPHYSTDIAAAWTVLEKFHAEGKGWAVQSVRGTPAWWCFNFNDEGLPLAGWGWEDDQIREGADTAPHAICLAALACLEKIRGKA